MYAAGQPIKIGLTRRQGSRLGGAKRTLAVLGAVAAANLALALVVHGGTPAVYTEVVVQPGDTLWAIASDRYPSSDVRAKVWQIEQINHLSGQTLQPGETLEVPSR